MASISQKSTHVHNIFFRGADSTYFVIYGDDMDKGIAASIQQAVRNGHCHSLQEFLTENSVENISAADILQRLHQTKDLPGTLRWAVQNIPLPPDGAGVLMEFIGHLWNSCSPKERGASEEEIERGPIEKELINLFIRDAQWQIPLEECRSQEGIDVAISVFQEQWLSTSMEHIGGKTPKEAVREERIRLGQSDTSWSFTMGITVVRDPHNS